MKEILSDQNLAEVFRLFLSWMGEDPDREGLKDTPRRMVEAYRELFSGYGVVAGRDKPKEHIERLMTTFEEPYDEMVLLRDIEFVSFCEHHVLPFSGKIHIAYIPDGRVIGVSKLARVAELFCRRLQIQERLTRQIVDTLEEYLKPKGSACVIEASHSCMGCRGVKKSTAVMTTSALEGEFLSGTVRSEFYSLIHS